jgi:hypothetical protein
MLVPRSGDGGQYPLKNVRKFLGQAGFDEDGRTSNSLCVGCNRGIDVTGENDDRDLTRGRIVLDVLNQLPPAPTVNELEIGDNGVRVFALELSQGAVEVGGGERTIPGKRETERVHLERVSAVVNQKDRGMGRGHRAL